MEGTRFHSIDVGGGSLVWLVFGRKISNEKYPNVQPGRRLQDLDFSFFSEG